MSTAASGLKELHQLHTQLHQVQQKLLSGPKKIRASEKSVQRKKDEIEASQQQLKELRMAADQKSLQLKTNEAKIIELKSKLNTATSNREFDIIRSQIDADEMANSVLEDEILEALDKVDKMQSTIEQLNSELQEATAKAKKVTDDVAAVEPSQQADAEELQGSLSIAERALPGQVAEVYRRLVQAHGADALAPVQNKSCTSCLTILRLNLIVELNVGKILFCPTCGKLLYIDEPE